MWSLRSSPVERQNTVLRGLLDLKKSADFPCILVGLTRTKSLYRREWLPWLLDTLSQNRGWPQNRFEFTGVGLVCTALYVARRTVRFSSAIVATIDDTPRTCNVPTAPRSLVESHCGRTVWRKTKGLACVGTLWISDPQPPDARPITTWARDQTRDLLPSIWVPSALFLTCVAL